MMNKCPTCNGTGKVVTNNRTAIHDCPDCRVKVDTVAVDGATGGATVGPKNVIEITDFPMYSAHCANPDNCPVCQTMCHAVRRAAIDQTMGIFLKWPFDKKLTPSKAVDAIAELKGRDDADS